MPACRLTWNQRVPGAIPAHTLFIASTLAWGWQAPAARAQSLPDLPAIPYLAAPAGSGGGAVAVGVDAAGFRRQGRRGDYQELLLGYDRAPWPDWTVGARLPLVRLSFPDRRDFGLADPWLFASDRFRPAPGREVDVDLEVELPLGDRDDGIGAGYLAVAPAVGWREAFGGRGAYGLARASLSNAFYVRDSDHSTPLYVRPREEMEADARLEAGPAPWTGPGPAGLPWAGGRLSPSLFADGAYALTSQLEHGRHRYRTDAGLRLAWDWPGGVQVLPEAAMGLPPEPAYFWRAGLRVEIPLREAAPGNPAATPTRPAPRPPTRRN